MAEYFEGIVRAINHCHQVDIIHRDIKPDNIMFGLDGSVKIIDFGFAKDNSSMVKDVCGSPLFMAPEVLRCYPEVEDHYVGYGIASDIWSLGVTLHFMLTGKYPCYAFTRNDLYE
jgi:serine/threonine protein kinase